MLVYLRVTIIAFPLPYQSVMIYDRLDHICPLVYLWVMIALTLVSVVPILWVFCYLWLAGILDILSGDMPKGTKIQNKHLEALIELHNMTTIFARNIQHLFSESDLQVLKSTLKAVYSPYESFKQRWFLKLKLL